MNSLKIIPLFFSIALFSSLAIGAVDTDKKDTSNKKEAVSTKAIAAIKIAYVNVTDLYNKSTFVEKANKTLQENVKGMEEKLLDERKKLQTLITEFEKATTTAKKESLTKKISTGQTELTSMTQQFQRKIKEEQDTGMQKFSSLVQAAVEKVAKEQHINIVVNSSAVVFADNTWIDITKDVANELQKE